MGPPHQQGSKICPFYQCPQGHHNFRCYLWCKRKSHPLRLRCLQRRNYLNHAAHQSPRYFELFLICSTYACMWKTNPRAAVLSPAEWNSRLQSGDPSGKQTLWKASHCSVRMSRPKDNVSCSQWCPRIRSMNHGEGNDRQNPARIQWKRQRG